MTKYEESFAKIQKLRQAFLQDGAAGILIAEQANFSYLTAGARGFLGLASVKACASLLITADRFYLVSNNIEAYRIKREEFPPELGELLVIPWWEEDSIPKEIERVIGDGKLLTDNDAPVAQWLKNERLHLTEEEISRYREISQLAAEALEQGLKQSVRGQSEYETAGILAKAIWSKGLEPISLFVAADERKTQVRHFIPTEKKAFHCLVASICARKYGLVVSATRTLYFEDPTAEEVGSYRNLLEVEAEFLNALVPGNSLENIYRLIPEAYEKHELQDEWKNHHQGGAAGYLAREIKIDRTSHGVIDKGQVFAFNPSCRLAKAEDTVLVTDSGVEILSRCQDWPVVEVHGRIRPDLLIMK